MRWAWVVALSCQAAGAEEPILVRATEFVKQEKTAAREWRTVADFGTRFLQALPDTRVTHADRLIRGENFTDEAGLMAVVSYEVNFPAAGRYYVWVRAYSTGTEDNGIHVGLNDTWPESGRRMQWCEGKNAWTWASKQRTAAQHCGEPGKIWLDVPAPGRHTVRFSMREDGFRFDRFLLTRDAGFQP
jgi:hypothetical protein